MINTLNCSDKSASTAQASDNEDPKSDTTLYCLLTYALDRSLTNSFNLLPNLEIGLAFLVLSYLSYYKLFCYTRESLLLIT